MNDRAMQTLLGPTGSDALRTARRALTGLRRAPVNPAVSWAAWSEREWTFTFVERHPPRRLVVDVPHDGSEVAISVRPVSDRPGSGPLAD